MSDKTAVADKVIDIAHKMGRQEGFQAGLKRAAEIAGSVRLGEDLIRISMGAEINHVKLWAIVSRSIEQAILKEAND